MHKSESAFFERPCVVKFEYVLSMIYDIISFKSSDSGDAINGETCREKKSRDFIREIKFRHHGKRSLRI